MELVQIKMKFLRTKLKTGRVRSKEEKLKRTRWTRESRKEKKARKNKNEKKRRARKKEAEAKQLADQAEAAVQALENNQVTENIAPAQAAIANVRIKEQRPL